ATSRRRVPATQRPRYCARWGGVRFLPSDDSRPFASPSSCDNPAQSLQSYRRTVPSRLPAKMRQPLGEKATLVSLALGPLSRSSGEEPRHTSQSPPAAGPAVTSQRPSKLYAAALMT